MQKFQKDLMAAQGLGLELCLSLLMWWALARGRSDAEWDGIRKQKSWTHIALTTRISIDLTNEFVKVLFVKRVHFSLTEIFSLKLFLGCRIENCDSCFSKDFCTKCKVGFYLHRGRCFDECPDGFAPLDETMECVGK